MKYLADVGLVLKKIQQDVKILLEWVFNPQPTERDLERLLIPVPVEHQDSNKRNSLTPILNRFCFHSGRIIHD
jgi:hypothetical protein